MLLLFLLPACVVSALACARLCRAVAATNTPGSPEEVPSSAARPDDGIGLFDAAYLAGGPERVAELVLVRMALRGRLLLAHTGWTTVARPEAGDELEEAALAAIGPEGQCRTEELRQALAGDPAVLEIAIRLAGAGLAVPSWVRERTSSAVRAVRHALSLTVLCLLTALLSGATGLGPSRPHPAALASWFALPLILTTGTLLMARVDVYPYTRWAAPAGQELLRRLGGMRRDRGPRGASPRGRWWATGGGNESLAAVAVTGSAAIRDPLLRAALRPPRRWATAADW